MKLFNDLETSTFWMEIMDELSGGSDDPQLSYKILAKLCEFFDFGFSFIYHTDHQGILNLDVQFSRRKNEKPLQKQIDLKKLLEPYYYQVFSGCKFVYAATDVKKSVLEERIEKEFEAPTVLLFPIKGEEGEILGIIGLADKRKERRNAPLNKQFTYSVLVLISNYVKLQLNIKKIEFTEKALGNIADNLGVDLYVNDLDNHSVLYANKTMRTSQGESDDSLIGMKCYHMLYNSKKEPCTFCTKEKIFDKEGKPTKVYAWDLENANNNTWFKILCTGISWEKDKKACVVSRIDITEQKRLEQSIEKMAEKDALTGLPNKERLFHDMENLMQEKTDFYLLFLDVNKFKNINDQYGHRMGDELLKAIAKFLNKIKATGSTVYRYAGDEFAIVIRNGSRQSVTRIAKKIEKQGKQWWNVLEEKLSCSASVGIASYPHHGSTPKELLENADKAMYVAKEREGKTTFFNYKKMAAKKARNKFFKSVIENY